MGSLRCFRCPMAVVVMLAVSGCAGEQVRSDGATSGSPRQGPPPSVSAVYRSVGESRVTAPALRSARESSDDGIPSFCKLNPEACPDLPPPPPEPNEPTADPWKSFACIQACEVGGDAIAAFCRALPGKTKRQIAVKAACWGASQGSEIACKVFCRAYFGPPRSSTP